MNGGLARSDGAGAVDEARVDPFDGDAIAAANVEIAGDGAPRRDAQRNRARRILREVWRSLAPLVPRESQIVVVARGGILGARTKELEAEMRTLLEGLGGAPS